MAEEQNAIKFKARVKLEKFTDEQDPAIDTPYEVIEKEDDLYLFPEQIERMVNNGDNCSRT